MNSRHFSFERFLALSSVIVVAASSVACQGEDAASTQNAKGASAATAAMQSAFDAEQEAFLLTLDTPEYMTAFSGGTNDQIALSGDKGGQKAPFDLFKAAVRKAMQATSRNICQTVQPYIKGGGNGFTHPYFHAGYEASMGVSLKAIIGMNLVWDLYNLEYAQFFYSGAEAVSSIGLSGSAYVGLGWGKKPGVLQAWSGRFSHSSVGFSLPFLEPILGGSVQVFSGFDEQKKDVDLSIVGGSVGLGVGLSVPSPMPVSFSAGSAFWVPSDVNTERDEKRFKAAGIKAQIVTAKEGKLVRFDSPSKGASYIKRSTQLASSIGLTVPTMQAIPGIMAAAIAIGAFRDLANSEQGKVCR